jgi:hypothetical protein
MTKGNNRFTEGSNEESDRNMLSISNINVSSKEQECCFDAGVGISNNEIWLQHGRACG